MTKRKAWIDQARGLSIFLVVYGHNFPQIEPYIYSFHVPLFFFIAGMFHPDNVDFTVIKRRAKMILVPYFIWASLLFLFWWAVGRNFGKSSELNLSVMDNFIGIFYAQGGQAFMNWGIPLWFLPCVFVLFLCYSALQKIKPNALYFGVLVMAVSIGFIWPALTGIHLPWSLDVALVALVFYSCGKHLKEFLFQIKGYQQILLLVSLFLVHFISFYFNTEKVDMYRSTYGNQLLFALSGLCGSVFYILFFKTIPWFKFLTFIGKHTIVILATHLRALTIIKLLMLLILGAAAYEFNELEKFILAIAQVLIIIPLIYLINKFVPILDGKVARN